MYSGFRGIPNLEREGRNQPHYCRPFVSYPFTLRNPNTPCGRDTALAWCPSTRWCSAQIAPVDLIRLKPPGVKPMMLDRADWLPGSAAIARACWQLCWYVKRRNCSSCRDRTPGWWNLLSPSSGRGCKWPPNRHRIQRLRPLHCHHSREIEVCEWFLRNISN